MSFTHALNELFNWEGGYSNDPVDAGGATNHGISLRFYKENIDRYADADDIKNLSPEAIEKIYKDYFWDSSGVDRLQSYALASKVFDGVVLHGRRTGVKMLQKALGDVRVDGILGPKTAGAANTSDTRRLLAKLRKERLDYVEAIVDANPPWKKFEKGWTLRALA